MTCPPAFIRAMGLLIVIASTACRSGGSGGSGVVVREVLHGDAASDTAMSGSAEVAPSPPDVATTLGTTVVSDTPAAIYRQAQERSRRTLDADNLRHNLKMLGEAVESS